MIPRIRPRVAPHQLHAATTWGPRSRCPGDAQQYVSTWDRIDVRPATQGTGGMAMHAARWASIGAAGVMLAGQALVGAAPVSAVDLSEGCQALNASRPNQWAQFVGYVFNAGEVIAVSFANPSDGATTGYLKVNLITRDLTSIPGTASFTFRNTDSYSVGMELDIGTSDWNWSCGVVQSPSPGSAAASTADGQPIPSWTQARGRDGMNATCEIGWGPSWQEWAEPVTGGWVCTRSIPMYGE